MQRMDIEPILCVGVMLQFDVNVDAGVNEA